MDDVHTEVHDDAEVPDDAPESHDDDEVTEVRDDATGLKIPANPNPDDNNYIDFDLPSLDAASEALAGHPAWPWVRLSEDGDGVEVVDYSSLSMG